MTNEEVAVAVWFRRDLRVTDHEPLLEAAASGRVSCVYCLDPREFGPTRELGLPRCGGHRTRFLIESLADLRSNLRRLGGELLIRRGRPEDVLPAMAREFGWQRVFYHQLVGTEEEAVERAVVRELGRMGCSVSPSWGLTLLGREELPHPVEETPEVFTRFRKAVEKLGGFRDPLPDVANVRTEPGVDPGPVPTLAEVGVEAVAHDQRAVLPFPGGESAGRARVAAYFWEEDGLRHYKQTRNEMVGASYSSKLAPWFAHGCLSPRWVQAEVSRYESERVRNESTYWMTFELLWRDYFQLIAAKHGARLFRPSGLQGIDLPWQRDERAFVQWREGRSGFPLVDANMRELRASGFMSNRGRQVVASFLTKNLGIDWRWGAEWFESQLLDHDVAANYGNWNYVAGVGNDAREFRYFHLPTQARKYDAKGRHAALWCPELAGLSAAQIHSPWRVSEAELESLGVVLGRDYPRPMVDLDRSVQVRRRAVEAALSR